MLAPQMQIEKDETLNPVPLERQAAILLATRRPEQLWALDRLVFVPEGRTLENSGHCPAIALLVSESFALACTLLAVTWGTIWAQAKARLHVELCQLHKSFRHRYAHKSS
jgi:hypothetical protein